MLSEGWGLLVATSGDLIWPPVRTFSWPWTIQDRELGARLRQGPVLRRRATGDLCGQPASAPPTLGAAHVRLSPDCLGLVNLNGIVDALRPNRAWRALLPNTAGEGRR